MFLYTVTIKQEPEVWVVCAESEERALDLFEEHYDDSFKLGFCTLIGQPLEDDAEEKVELVY